jgi:hypothetical protein
MDRTSRGDAVFRRYDESVSQLSPRPKFEPDFRDYKPIQPRGTDWCEIGRRIWAPFAAIGAFIAKFGVEHLPQGAAANAWREFQLAIAGPLLGSLGALAVYGFSVAEDSNRR